MVIERDVIIVGAGISGSVCAAYLAAAGVDVLLVDKEIFPREKACGDIIREEALNHVSRLGCFADLDKMATLIRRLHLISPNGSECVIPFEGYAIPRHLTDQILVDAAVEHGAEFRDECKVLNLIRESGYVRGVRINERGVRFELRCRMVILACGADSYLADEIDESDKKVRSDKSQSESAKSLGFTSSGRFIGERAYFAGVNLEESLAKNQYNCYGVFGFHSKLPGGYYWIVPSGEDGYSGGYCNVGYIADSQHCQVRAEELFAELLSRNRRVASLLGGAKRVTSWTGGRLNSQDAIGARCGNGYIAIGDAASGMMPFIKDGISPAADQAEAAALAAKKAINANDFSRGFWQREYLPKIAPHDSKLRTQRLAAETSYDWTVIDKVIARMLNNPAYIKNVLKELLTE